MKTIIYLVILAGLCIFLFGCGGSEAPDEHDVTTLPVTCAPTGCTQ